MTRKRTLAYGRTSLDRSDGRSVDDQLSELAEWAGREGRDVIGQHRDDGISASRFARGKERPGWRAVMDALTNGDVDELALWEGSRGSRDLVEWAQLIDRCAEYGVDIAVRGKVYDAVDPGDRQRLLHDAVDAEYESGRTSQRVQRASRSRAVTGRPNGRVNFGYMIEYDSTTGKPGRRIPDPERAPAVREMVTRLLGGDSAGAIARDLNAQGVLTRRGGLWTGPNVIKIAQNPVYAGLRTSARYTLPDGHRGDWEPLVSREEHDRLITMLADPTRKAIRTGLHIKHLLTGVARCGRCDNGGRIRTITRQSRRTGVRTIAYTCSVCHGVARSAAPVDAYVEGVVIKFLSRDDVMDQLSDPGDATRAEARAEAARLTRKLAELEAQIDTDELDVATGARLVRSTRVKLERAEAGARPAHMPPTVLNVAGSRAAERWDATPVGKRREIIRALFTVTIERGTVGGRPVFDPSTVTIQRRRP